MVCVLQQDVEMVKRLTEAAVDQSSHQPLCSQTGAQTGEDPAHSFLHLQQVQVQVLGQVRRWLWDLFGHHFLYDPWSRLPGAGSQVLDQDVHVTGDCGAVEGVLSRGLPRFCLVVL